MDKIAQARCRGCAAKLQHTFVDLGVSPLANSYLKPEQLSRKECFYPLHALVCDNCFLVQLEAVTSPEEIFSDYAYFSSYSDSWLAHAKSYVDAVSSRFALGEHSQVVEIASNDGYLLQYFIEKGIPVLGIEPAHNIAKIAALRGIPTLTRFFTKKVAKSLICEGKQADLIIGNNVLAHVPDFNGFVEGMKILLRPEGVITLEFPHLMRLTEENQFDTIYHEHFSYFSLLTIQKLFKAHGLKIFDVEELPTHGGSLRIYAAHESDDTKVIGSRVEELLRRETAAGYGTLARYLSFGERVKETKRKFLEFIVDAKAANKSIVGYGAPAKGNTLLNYCGVGSDFIDYTVDRSPHKQGHFLPGTRIPIYAPERIGETKPDYVLILPWNLKDEITEQMSHISEWGGRFVVPIPEVKVL
jgi:2-polyprenyl-3-methyl-5-hydroxy-6-metoxy-1,4-benzoquinol methylase